MIRAHERRGQSGLTIIELLMVVTIGTIVLIPMFALVNHTLLRRDPTVDSADASKQLRLLRNQLERDWVSARVIKIGVGASGTECNEGGMTAFLPPNTGPLIAMQVSNGRLDNNGVSRRVIYNSRPSADPTDDPAAIDILRRECSHTVELIPALTGPDVWGLGGSVNATGGSQRVVAKGIKELRLPGTCNLQASFPKAPPATAYETCDMTLSIIGMDNQVSTIRLYQHVGRDS